MSYITHSKDEFNRTVCKKRKQKRTGLYIRHPRLSTFYFIGKDGDFFTGIIPEYFFEVYILAQSSISPSTISMCNACGSLGNPGIRRISPAMATIISAPLLITISLIWNSKLSTAP